MNESKKEQMQKVFDIRDEKYQTSLFVNMRLADMPKNELLSISREYGISPVEEYLDIRTIKQEEGNRNVRGFIRYIDTYLIERSGGKRTELLKIGEQLIGKKPESFSMRLIRLEIISEILSSYVK